MTDHPVILDPNSTDGTTTEPPTQSMAEALVALQSQMPRIAKTETAHITRNGIPKTYQYADLADVSALLLPMLAQVGLAFSTRPTVVDGQFMLVYSLVHVCGQREEGSYPLPESQNPHTIGSAITYARRYCLLAVTGAAPDNEDDDARMALPSQGTKDEFLAEIRSKIDAATTLDELRKLWGKADNNKGLIGSDAFKALEQRMMARSHDFASEAPPEDQLTYTTPTSVPSQMPPQASKASEVPAMANHQDPAIDPTPPSPPTQADQSIALQERANRIAAAHREGDTSA